VTAGFRIPDRYEAVVRMANGQDLRSLVEEVRDGLSVVDELYDELESSGRGAFLIVEGPPGSGKTTFLSTVYLFRQGVITVAIEPREPIPKALETLGPVSRARLRIVTIKDRESLSRTPVEDLGEALTAINQFLRTAAGLHTLIAWPCNSRDLCERLVALAREIGGTALLSSRDGAFRFHGPPRSQYLSIARRTIATFNAGATLVDLGITEERAARLAGEADTIGAFLLRLNQEARQNQGALTSRLPEQERYSIFIVVVAGNGAEGDTDALTRGAYFTADIDRLLASTDANLVKGLKAQPEKLGVLATMFDAKLIYVAPAAAMAVVRDFADDGLRARLEEAGFPSGPDSTGVARLAESRLALALRGEAVGLQQAGRKLGDRSLEQFQLLTELAAKDDAALNRAFGRALLGAGLVQRYEDEKPLNVKEKRSGDLLCQTEAGPVLLEFMWRRRTTRGAIAQYLLTKLVQYGRNIGFLGEGAPT
jgi:DNA polymerase III delta prime subunit